MNTSMGWTYVRITGVMNICDGYMYVMDTCMWWTHGCDKNMWGPQEYNEHMYVMNRYMWWTHVSDKHKYVMNICDRYLHMINISD